jgi:hypothetical protein
MAWTLDVLLPIKTDKASFQPTGKRNPWAARQRLMLWQSIQIPNRQIVWLDIRNKDNHMQNSSLRCIPIEEEHAICYE